MIDSVVRTRVRQIDPEVTVDTNKLTDVVRVWRRCMETLASKVPDITDGILEKSTPVFTGKLFPHPTWDIYIALKNDDVIGYIAAEGKLIVSFFMLPGYEGIGKHLIDHIYLLKGAFSVQLLTADDTTRRMFQKYGCFDVDDGQIYTDAITGLPAIRMALP